MNADIQVHCRACGRAFAAPAVLAGQTVACPGCGQKARVPRPTAAEAAERQRTLSSTSRIDVHTGGVPPPAPPRRVVIKRPKGA